MNNTKEIKLSGICHESLVNGEGMRRVYFSQGCNHNCKGCFNPYTHSFTGGKVFNIDNLIEDVLDNPMIKGVTFSGGDPLQQYEPFLYFAKKLKKYNINIWCYTGYTFDELFKLNKIEILKYIDVLVDGKFQEDRKQEGLKFRGSSNQRIINVKESLKQNKIILKELKL